MKQPWFFRVIYQWVHWILTIDFGVPILAKSSRLALEIEGAAPANDCVHHGKYIRNKNMINGNIHIYIYGIFGIFGRMGKLVLIGLKGKME